MVATGVPIFKSLVHLDPEISKRRKLELNPGSAALESDALTKDRLCGLVVKASASRAEDPGFESRLLRDFFRDRVIPVT